MCPADGDEHEGERASDQESSARGSQGSSGKSAPKRFTVGDAQTVRIRHAHYVSLPRP